LEHYKAKIGESHLLVDDEGDTRAVVEQTKLARGCTIAIGFIKGADPQQYSTQ
jgi:hypothetical protein